MYRKNLKNQISEKSYYRRNFTAHLYEPRHAKRALSVAVTSLRNDVTYFRVKKNSTRVCLNVFYGLKSV